MPQIPDPTSNTLTFTPPGNRHKVEAHFSRLRDLAGARFGHLRLNDPEVMFWDPENGCVVVHFPPSTDDQIKENVHYYMFGFFEALGA